MKPKAFEERPEPKHNRTMYDYTELIEHLKENPGKWVLVRTAPTSNAANVGAFQIRRGTPTCFGPAGTFDAYASGNEIIATYTGEEGK